MAGLAGLWRVSNESFDPFMSPLRCQLHYSMPHMSHKCPISLWMRQLGFYAFLLKRYDPFGPFAAPFALEAADGPFGPFVAPFRRT